MKLNELAQKILNKNYLEPDEVKLSGYTLLLSGDIYMPDNQFRKADILFKDNKIIAIDEIDEAAFDENETIQVADIKNYYLTPGIIEQHIHGAFGVDFNHAGIDEIVDLMRMLPDFGVGKIYPTVMTDKIETINAQIDKITQAQKIVEKSGEKMTQIAGINLEGPFLSGDFKGIHPTEDIIQPTIENLKRISLSSVKLLTYAPEKDSEQSFLNYLRQHDIIPSAGHSAADAATLRNAAKNGKILITHLFNAMPKLHHRESSLTTEALINDNVYVELIVDAEHVKPEMIELVLKSKPSDKIIFISDALPLAHYKYASINFAGEHVTKKKNYAVSDSNTIAGSTLLLSETYPILKETIDLNFADFIKYSTTNSAELLGVSNDTFALWKKDNYKVRLL